MAFHCLAGCDHNSYVFNHSKAKSWAVFKENANLLNGIGEGPVISDNVISHVEQFFCMWYNVLVTSVDKARSKLFSRIHNPELLLPTSDALRHHVYRANCLALLANSAHEPTPSLPKPEATGGWICARLAFRKKQTKIMHGPYNM